LRLFIEYAPAALAIFDREMRYIAASQRWKTDYQLTDPQLVGRSHYDLFPEMPEEWKDAHRRGLSGEVVRADEDRLVRSNGQIQLLRWEIRPWRLADGSVGGIVIFTEDITEQVTAKRTLKERKERLRAILDTVADAIITIDHQGLITSINPSAEKMFGYSRDELVGQNVSTLMPTPYRDEHDGYLARYRETGEPRIIGVGRELTGLRKDGSLFPIELAVSMVDHLNLYTGVIRDISERKELQKHVLEIASDEQRRIGQELHDGIQQELTGLSLFAGVLSDGLKNAVKKKSVDELEFVLKQVELAKLQHASQRLTEGLKATTKHVQEISHGIMPVQLDSEGLQDALQSLAISMNSEQVQCRFECANPTAIVVSNTAASHLYRIAQEAVTNSLRHGRSTKIQISLSATRATLQLEVSDNGIGFDPAIQGAAKGLSAGMGRRIMEYRASMIGGVVRFERRKEGGMHMACSVPCGVTVA
jgi:PAS domain S-box-containing protein